MWGIILVGLILFIFPIATPVSSLIMIPGLLFIIYGLYKLIKRRKHNTEGYILKRSEGLTLLSIIAGGIAGWGMNVGLSILTDNNMTHLYGISIFLGIIVGLLWDITDKLNKD